jgi:hypothetical protein
MEADAALVELAAIVLWTFEVTVGPEAQPYRIHYAPNRRCAQGPHRIACVFRWLIRPKSH